MNNSKSENYIKIGKLIDVLTEHNNKIKAYDKYLKILSSMAQHILDDESILANTRIEFRIKKKVKKRNKNNNPRDLLDLLTSSGTPDEFARNLDSIQDKIAENRDEEKGWEERHLKLDDLDNRTFIAMLSRIIDVIKEHKSTMDDKTKELCKKL
jgi:phage shock protein A